MAEGRESQTAKISGMRPGRVMETLPQGSPALTSYQPSHTALCHSHSNISCVCVCVCEKVREILCKGQVAGWQWRYHVGDRLPAARTGILLFVG